MKNMIYRDCNAMASFGLESIKNYNNSTHGLQAIHFISDNKESTINIDSIIDPYATKQITTK